MLSLFIQMSLFVTCNTSDRNIEGWNQRVFCMKWHEMERENLILPCCKIVESSAERNIWTLPTFVTTLTHHTDVWIGVMMIATPDPVMRAGWECLDLSQLPIRKVIPEIEWQFDIWANLICSLSLYPNYLGVVHKERRVGDWNESNSFI